jgi:dynein heavy chain
MLDSYHQLVNGFEAAEERMMASHLNHIRKVLRPGLTRINWSSLGIADFVNKTTQVNLQCN